MVQIEGEYRHFVLKDDGTERDEKPDDGIYTGRYGFGSEERGLWMIHEITEDINYAQQDMTPEEAAKIIGGMVLTHQLTIDFSGRELVLLYQTNM